MNIIPVGHRLPPVGIEVEVYSPVFGLQFATLHGPDAWAVRARSRAELRWGDPRFFDPSYDETVFTPDELCEQALTITHWVDPDDESLELRMIPITEALPIWHRPVVVYGNGNTQLGMLHHPTIWENGPSWAISSRHAELEHAVTHWLPIPFTPGMLRPGTVLTTGEVAQVIPGPEGPAA